MPGFNGGVNVNHTHGRTSVDGRPRKKSAKYLRVSAGPQRGRYVHDLIMEAILGRPLELDETVEHRDGDGLNVGLHADGKLNLIVVSRSVNTRLRHQRERRARRLELEVLGQQIIKGGVDVSASASISVSAYIPWTEQF